MPRYDYTCAHNGRTIEVSHSMSERVECWGELCDKAGIELGDSPADAPVFKELSTGTLAERSARKNDFSLPPSCACGHTHGCSGH